MLKSLFKSLAVLFIYYASNFLLAKLFAFIFIRDIFSNVNTSYFLLINTFIYILFSVLAYFFIKKQKPSLSNELISFKNIFVVIVLIFSFRVFEDPILRMEIIVGKLMIPDKVENNSLSMVSNVITFINIIVLAPLFEELFFKRIILNFFDRKKFLIGMLISSIGFTLIHINPINWNSITSVQLLAFFLFGLVSCIIYFRYGLFHSILFHSGYNLLWFIANVGLIEYWKILKNLNFGIGYWGLVVLSIISLSYYMFKFSKYISSGGKGTN